MKQECLRCLLLLAGLGLTIAAIVLTGVVQEWTGERISAVLEMSVAQAVVGCLLVAFDWIKLGARVAVHHSTVAIATAWLVAVPLGLAILALIEWEPLIGLSVLCVVAAMAPTMAFGPAGCCVGSVVAYGIIMLSGTVSKVDVEFATRLSILGIVLVSVAVYWPVRYAITLRRIEDWPNIIQVDPNSDEFREKCKEFEQGCQLRADKYPFNLSVVSLYRLQGQTWRPKRGHMFGSLFHGTSWEGAKGIVSEGFRLPEHPGMFGKGIYFADSPLKSWQYASHDEAIPQPCCGACACCTRGALIMMCLVDLGEPRVEHQANTGLQGYDRRSCWACITCQSGAYDSVVGLSMEHGGVLRVPEYVIYNPNQARVDYIFEVALHDA